MHALDSEALRWLRRNAALLGILLLIFGLAWFLRAWFAWDLAAPEGLVSGGSDAFYYERIIRHVTETGRHLDFDPLLNYPLGLTNPRPPMFAWFNAVTGSLLSPFTEDPWTAVSAVFLMSTAFWGALTIFPTYLLARDAFGKRTGIIAAFLLAVLPAHLQRSPATNGDHDAMVLFFAVTSFYFFFKALEVLIERRWVSSWRERKAVLGGLRAFASENRRSLLYSALSGWSMAVVALTWQGWAYVPVILIVYFLLQIFVHRLRNLDPLGIVACFAVTLGLPLLVASPWYLSFGQVGTWFDVPAYLYVVALVFGILFTITRDLPWALVTPTILGLAGLGFLVLAAVNPAVANAFLSGAGYFVRNKVYETIAEAQAPGLSQAILSFGVASYYLSLGGLGLMVLYYITGRDTRPFYLFALVWSFAAIFMSMAAARFIFNASPAFAITGAWLTAKVIQVLDFDDFKKRFYSTHGGPFTSIRKSVHVGQVLGAMLLASLLLVPNVFYATDAAIPYEKKAAFDAQLYQGTPEFLRPAGYSSAGGSFYLGAFGYSLPLSRNYYPAAWSWFATQDADLPDREKPAYLSWWDYGFEAVDKGDHPTVADNFQNGFEIAGNFIAAQGEAEGIAYLSARLIEGDWRQHGQALSPGMRAFLRSAGVDADRIHDVFARPGDYVAEVLDHPLEYGRRDTRLQLRNVQYTVVKAELLETQPGADAQADLYRGLRQVTGNEIRYFAADARLFPTSGQNTGIFYAPMKLSDQRVLELADGRTIPIDFFKLLATVGSRDIPVEDVTPDQTVTDVKIVYQPQFYESMFYRAYIGFKPTDIGGQSDEGVPGISGPSQGQTPLPAWNLSHWRVVYLTSYYNPYPTQEEVSAHREASVAVNYFDALEMQKDIDAGTLTGTVLINPVYAVSNGVVFVKYYDGAFLNGTVTIDGVQPLAGARVVVSDELEIPHDVAITGPDGRYALLAPFGDLKVTVSTGAVNGRTLEGATIHSTARLTVSDDAAMRRPTDADSDGRMDYLIDLDLQVAGVSSDGTAFLDDNRDGSRGLTEALVPNALIDVQHNVTTAFTASWTTNEEGEFRVENLLPGPYNLNVTLEGRRIAAGTVAFLRTQDAAIAIPAADVGGRIADETGGPVPGATVSLEDSTTGEVRTATTLPSGSWTLTGLLPGGYNVTAEAGDLAVPSRFFSIGLQQNETLNLTAYRSATVSGQTLLPGAFTEGHVSIRFQRADDLERGYLVRSDGNGAYRAKLPIGRYLLSAAHQTSGRDYAFGREYDVTATGGVLDIPLRPAALAEGLVFGAGDRTSILPRHTVRFEASGTLLEVRTNLGGAYSVLLPEGDYMISSSSAGLTKALIRHERVTAGVPQRIDMDLGEATRASGTVFVDRDGDGRLGPQEGLLGARVAFSNSEGTFVAVTNPDGEFIIALPAGPFAPRGTAFGHDMYVGIPVPARESDLILLSPSTVRVMGRVQLSGGTGPDLSIAFLSQRQFARPITALTASDGSYVADVPPGNYTAEIDEADGDFRVQLREAVPLRVQLGDPVLTLDLPAVRRTSVTGTVTLAGEGKPATLTFTGPDTVSVTAGQDGSFSTFLALGTYTVQGNLTEDALDYGAIALLEVSGPATLVLPLDRAVRVRGFLQHLGATLAEELEIRFTAIQGATVVDGSSALGEYSADLMPGTYEVTVDAPSEASFAGASRPVRYAHRGQLTVAPPGPINYNVALDRLLDNSTVAGRVREGGVGVAATVRFIARDAQALNASVDTALDGRYSVAVTPGLYTVYVANPLTSRVFLDRLEVPLRESTDLDLPLMPGLRVSGVLIAVADEASRPVAGSLSFTGPAELPVETETGGYAVLVPPGDYTVSGSATREERGINVTYEGSGELGVTADRTFDLALAKKIERTVALSWNASERQQIRQGGSVTYTVAVKNTGNEDDRYLLSASVTGWTFAFTPTTVSVPFGSAGEIGASVTVTITAPADAPVVHPALVLTARSATDSTTRGTATVEVDIARVRGVSLSPATAAPVYDGGFLNHTITVRNRGNAEESFRITVQNPSDLQSLFWLPRLLRSPTDAAETTLANVTVGANATVDVTLRLQRLGATPLPATAALFAADESDPSSLATLSVDVTLPRLDEGATVTAAGPGVSAQAPLDWPLLAVVLALVAVIGLAAYVYYKERFGR